MSQNFRFDVVMKVANDVVKFIRVKALYLRQFQNFLTAKWEAHRGNVIYYCDIR